MKKRIGWVPFCEIGPKNNIGPWLCSIDTNKQMAQHHVRNLPKLRFKILPVFIEVPKEIKNV
jgi:hypothetical protein